MGPRKSKTKKSKTKKYKKCSRTNFNLGSEMGAAINKHLAENPLDLFHIPGIRQKIAAARFKSVGADGIETFRDHDPAVIEHTIEYNKKQLESLAALERPRLLIDVLTSILYVNQHAGDLKVLCVGPRTEAEIFMLLAAGFKPENVRGLDLISYSDYVDLGDMHAMPYEDDSFDIVILGWVIAYSHDNQKVADEVVRVTKPGGYVAIGVERDPAKGGKLHGYELDGTFFESTREIEKLFDDHVEMVLFRHDVHRRMRDVVCHLMLVMELH